MKPGEGGVRSWTPYVKKFHKADVEPSLGARKQGGFARNGAQNPPPLFFGAGLLAEVPKSLLGSIKIPSFPKVL